MQYQLAQVRERLGEGVVRVTPADFAEIRSLSVDEIGDYITLTDEAIQSMREAGHPAVENGAQISSALTGLLMDLRPVFVGWREKARDLPINDPDRFVQGARELGLGAGPQIEAVLSEQAIDDRLPDSFPRELRDAFRNEPACDGFRAANPEYGAFGDSNVFAIGRCPFGGEPSRRNRCSQTSPPSTTP